LLFVGEYLEADFAEDWEVVAGDGLLKVVVTGVSLV
jgi:hypothetical protein